MINTKIHDFIEKSKNFVIAIIILNAIVLGLQTSKTLNIGALQFLDIVDKICLSIFVIEIMLKCYSCRIKFFCDGWNVFDFLVVGIALIPSQDGLSILRVFRVFRVMRLITAIQSMRRVVHGMIIAIPGVGSVAGLLLLFFYIGAVMATNFFGEKFPVWFEDIGKSMYTLFQIMTLESWSMGIVRPVMEQYPYAWIFFIPFIIVTTFTVLNLFIGIIVDAMAAVKAEENLEKYGERRDQTTINIEAIRKDIEELKSDIKTLSKK